MPVTPPIQPEVFTRSGPFLLDSYNTVRGVEIDYPADADQPAGTIRKARVVRKTEEADKNITLLIYVDYYNAAGQRMLNIIESDATLSETAKQKQRINYATFGFSKSTLNSWVNPATGGIVKPDVDGNYPDGSLPELTWLQGLTTENLQALGLPVTRDTPNLRESYYFEAAMLSIIRTRENL